MSIQAASAPITIFGPNPKSDVIDCFEPATRVSLGQVPVDTEEDVALVVARARKAQAQWKHSTFAQRRKVLENILDYILDHSDEICEIVARDAGKTRENALLGEILPACEKIRWTLKNGERHLRDEKVSSGILLHKKARIEYHPRGVIGGIIPWNYPFQNMMMPVVPALFAGNAVVLKPSEWVAWSSQQFMKIFHEALAAAGAPVDLIQVVQGFGATGNALVRAVDGIIFIGSCGNGRRVIEASAERIIPVTMELGGKDAFIVCEDANIQQALSAAITGTFLNSGQNCVASERILVHDKIYAEFEKQAAATVKAFKQSNPLGGGQPDMGSMNTPIQLALVEKLVNDSIAAGARLVTGGKRVLSEEGEYYAPTILADVDSSMPIMQEETFGPVLVLCRFHSDDEAVEIANSTPFGLSNSVFSANNARANAIARRVESGMCSINELGGMTYFAGDLPFGGVKQSGFGRIGGRDGLRSLCHAKAVLDERVRLPFAMSMLPNGASTYETASAGIRAMYSRKASDKFKGFRELLRIRKSVKNGS
ncbi:aldehyde dehydrogenase family protein [Zhongshania guokunii]|uniref:Aldehyde dehydrogenase n=1 Tax=Zhongshania guokunii TaxID=641783 RepID=A0ABV3U3J4_9GAMM